MDEVQIAETTQKQVEGALVGAANIFEDEYATGSGETGSALHVTLSIYDPETDDESDHRVRVGQTVVVRQNTYRVAEVNRGAGNRGSVVLVRSN